LLSDAEVTANRHKTGCKHRRIEQQSRLTASAFQSAVNHLESPQRPEGRRHKPQSPVTKLTLRRDPAVRAGNRGRPCAPEILLQCSCKPDNRLVRRPEVPAHARPRQGFWVQNARQPAAVNSP